MTLLYKDDLKDVARAIEIQKQVVDMLGRRYGKTSYDYSTALSTYGAMIGAVHGDDAALKIYAEASEIASKQTSRVFRSPAFMVPEPELEAQASTY
jgi:hypothetical protein